MQEKVASLLARCLPVHRIVQAGGVRLDSHCGQTGLRGRRREKGCLGRVYIVSD